MKARCAILAVLILWGLLAAALPVLAAAAPPQASVTFPYAPLTVGSTVYGLPLVQVRVNDAVTGTFLFDTGTNVSLLTDTLAAKLGLTPKPVLKDGHPFQVQGQSAEAVVVSRLQAGALRLNNVQMIVWKEQALVSLAQHPLDGIIGTNIMRFFPVLFDCARSQITIWRPGALTTEELTQAGFADAAAVPLADPSGDFLYSTVVLFQNGSVKRPDTLLIDTGAERTTIANNVAVDLGLQPSGKPESANFLGSSFPAWAATVETLTLGSASLNNVLVGYPAERVIERKLLGMDALMRFRVLMDFPENKMYLAPLIIPPG